MSYCTCVHSSGIIPGCHLCRPENFIKEEYPKYPYPYKSYKLKPDWRNHSRDLKKETYEEHLKKIDNFLTDIQIKLDIFKSTTSRIIQDFCEQFEKFLKEEKHKHGLHKQLRQARQKVREYKEQLKNQNKRICKKCKSAELANDDIEYCKICKEF